MGTKINFLKELGLDKLGKVTSQSLNKTKQNLNKTIQSYKNNRKKELEKKN